MENKFSAKNIGIIVISLISIVVLVVGFITTFKDKDGKGEKK